MNEIQAPTSPERAHRGAGQLYSSLAIAGAIGFAGLIAQVVAAMAYNPIAIWGPECPGDAWPDVASAISGIALMGVGIFLVAASMQVPAIWAGGQPQSVSRALVAVVLTAMVAAVVAAVVWIWLDALASADCVEEPGPEGFMQALPWGTDREA